MDKTNDAGTKECEDEEALFHSRQSMLMEMKWSPVKKYSVLLLLLLILSSVSTVSRLRNYVVLPSVCLRSGSDANAEAARLVQTHVGDESFWCDRSDKRTDICYMRGDVHLVPGNLTTLVLYSANVLASRHSEEVIWPYARKWDNLTLNNVEPVLLTNKHIEAQKPSSKDRSAVCDVVHLRPLLVFSTGGFTGNPYHDFNDVLIPLFINSRKYGGEVVFGILDVRDWWMDKFSAIFRLLSKHKIIDINATRQIHCFPEATVGLRVHAELAIYPSRMAHNETIKDFQQLLHQAFGGPDSDGPLRKRNTTADCLVRNATHRMHSKSCQLKLVIFSRKQSRIILNQDQVVKLAREEGFEVEVLEPSVQTEMRTLYRSLHSADVMIGVHGAALTHILFMRPRSVFIQIVPLGTAWPAYTYYQEPAENKLDLQYLEYRITPEESTLTRTYSIDDIAVTDPEAVIAKNWEIRKRIYLQGQNVRLLLPNVQSTLHEAERLALQAFPRRR